MSAPFDPIAWRDALLAKLPAREEMLASVEKSDCDLADLNPQGNVRINRVGSVKLRQGARKAELRRRGM